MIKIFSSFIFARNDTKTPFYFSLISVILNIVISLSLFNKLGFIIIPIATTISSWLNGFLLLIFVLNKNYFTFNNSFFTQLVKISVVNIICLGLFKLLINYFSNYFIFTNSYKFLAIILLVLLTFAFYLLISILIKAFKISDIKLNY
jgi:putative peptidoglycan lipid II flippase